MFDQEEWDDDKSGKSLENVLFFGKMPETQQQTTKGKRKRKRKGKTSSDNVVEAQCDVKPCKARKKSKRNQISLIGGSGVQQSVDIYDAKPHSALENSINADDVSGIFIVGNDSKIVKPNRNRKAKSGNQRKKTMEIPTTETAVNKVDTVKKIAGNEKQRGTKNSRHKSNSILGSSKNAHSSHSEKSRMLRERVTSKLQSAHFRFLNEQLYSCQSKDAKTLFSEDPTAFQLYHTGYMKQVSKWPVNPLDLVISFLKKRPQKWVIGDFGCGDARLAASVKNTVHSFDLVAFNSRVTVADISDVPLPAECLDVAVFCLSLMGTNYTEFLRESNRTLKPKGLLIIAEVASRFTSVSKFVIVLKKFGFTLEKQDRKNTHFCMFHFRKSKPCQKIIDNVPKDLLKPCVYKKR